MGNSDGLSGPDGYAADMMEKTSAYGIPVLRTDPAARVVTDLTGDPEIDALLYDCIQTLQNKGAEYTIGSRDRLHNFRTVGATVDERMEKVWFTYFYKHFSALASYIKNGCKVKSNETIQSRIMDCIVYLLLFHKMTLEIERDPKPKP